MQKINRCNQRASAFLSQKKFEHRSGYSVSTCIVSLYRGTIFGYARRELGVSPSPPLVALPVLFP